MKIHNLNTGFDALGKVQPDAPAPAPATAPAVGRKDTPGDQVKLSSGAQLARSVMGAVDQAADIRYEKVARAKALLAAGEVGRDPFRLADAIVSRALENE
jgi:flagellar biosynthesis anti-sigma factor FlgM